MAPGSARLQCGVHAMQRQSRMGHRLTGKHRHETIVGREGKVVCRSWGEGSLLEGPLNHLQFDGGERQHHGDDRDQLCLNLLVVAGLDELQHDVLDVIALLHPRFLRVRRHLQLPDIVPQHALHLLVPLLLMLQVMDPVLQRLDFLNAKWDSDCIPVLEEYIRIPCQSPAYDPEWATNGLIEQAMDLLHGWVQRQAVPGLESEVFHEAGKTPFLLAKVPGTDPTFTKHILMYGHMDKQPPLLPWDEGLGPYTPVIRDGKLYGRAGADDGYAIFAAVTSIQAMQAAGIPHGPITIVVEADEESGSRCLQFWIDRLRDKLGTPDLIFCLDSGALSYDQLWVTSSLRGAMIGTLSVEILKEGVHSGIFGGIVPCTFRIVRQLLSRIEDEMSGEVLIPEAHTDIPADFIEQMKKLDELGPDFFAREAPLLQGCCGFQGLTSELGVANAWKPCLAVTGISGLPSVENAGNVLRKGTAVTLSIRLPPTVDSGVAMEALRKILERDPPHNARVTFTPGFHADGWAAPAVDDWLTTALRDASTQLFGKDFGVAGLGGTIPFMGMLGEMFPQAQFVITGVLGPKSNAHGPNEFLHIPYTKKIVACVASIVADHCRHYS
eukprot:GGOE01053094.1.p1 GENE.GGOE01053094.1~~GGOE01053094.1.p1  ORF type:complete len:609 (-),score=152.40 GGOE01053094.1:249-2075(-)